MKALQKEPPRTRTFTHSSGATVHETYNYRGYGSFDFVVEGTYDQVDAWVQSEQRSYPMAGYGGVYCWPPGRLNYKNELHSEQPIEFEPGKFRITASHSNSCD